ncbi:pyridoxal-phosphate dependent enzyme [Membranihabitans maritimus]|uniref:pyridoxal-phosphate dependent enzyme n=1 Tax=Membranihabitans maritimus TaxID=2904244 RepID=UPI001F31D92E|nr:pyridoxal-phosphate dependent enzyme [Membranihabitans maritimus]
MSAKVFDNILETIGDTPLVKINRLFPDVKATIYAKVEYFNPGHSIKDRIGIKMIEDAENAGLLKPGGTIIECTSGNTGMGIALASIVKGYNCIFTTNDKQSKEKLDLLRALGAEVVVCPTDVSPEDSRSYYSVAEKLNNEIPNSYWCNQYDNLSNREAHYLSTGPEIWEQTEGRITHFVVPVGTGGTISGTAKYLKERNQDVKIWGIDSYGSIFKKYKETGIFDKNEIFPYLLEGVGEDIIPENVEFDLIDLFEKVSDKDAAIMARKLARVEGILAGYSSGSAMQGIEQLKDQLKEGDIVVAILHDHGSRYINKVYNDDWMTDRGFLQRGKKVRHIIEAKSNTELIKVTPDELLKNVLNKITETGISQMPVFQNGTLLGSIHENDILMYVMGDESKLQNSVDKVMQDPFPIVEYDRDVSEVVKLLSRKNPAIMTRDRSGQYHIVTTYDLVKNLND